MTQDYAAWLRQQRRLRDEARTERALTEGETAVQSFGGASLDDASFSFDVGAGISDPQPGNLLEPMVSSAHTADEQQDSGFEEFSSSANVSPGDGEDGMYVDSPFAQDMYGDDSIYSHQEQDDAFEEFGSWGNEEATFVPDFDLSPSDPDSGGQVNTTDDDLFRIGEDDTLGPLDATTIPEGFDTAGVDANIELPGSNDAAPIQQDFGDVTEATKTSTEEARQGWLPQTVREGGQPAIEKWEAYQDRLANRGQPTPPPETQQQAEHPFEPTTYGPPIEIGDAPGTQSVGGRPSASQSGQLSSAQSAHESLSGFADSFIETINRMAYMITKMDDQLKEVVDRLDQADDGDVF